MSDALFKLILIEEIKRKSIDKSIKEFYSELPENELGFQLICVDATLSRGSLPLAEKYLIHKNTDRDHINQKINELSNHDFYFTTEKIYRHLTETMKNDRKPSDSILDVLNSMAVSGELDELLDNNTDNQ